MSDDTTSEQGNDRPGERGAAADAGIVDQQDALLAEMEAEARKGEDSRRR